MKIAIYPGTFDPITNGHIDIIERASHLFDKIIVTVARNPSKKPLLTVQERVFLIQQVVDDMETEAVILVEPFEGLIVDFAREKKANAIIRGLRAVSDFEYELQMALVNRRLAPEVSTVFLMPHEKYTYLNSTIVKEVASFGGDISNFVPPVVRLKLEAKFPHLKE
ncbi:MAG: pantetheine-phosphate adenylyltransferase [Calditrichaeota bacterium]|nr:MAG: pantetheine-phosphate adenylyltransferase [Calditrichota bacterium]